MGNDAPRELRFDFEADGQEPSAVEQKQPDTVGSTGHPAEQAVRGDDHSANLKRRVDELRSESRRASSPDVDEDNSAKAEILRALDDLPALEDIEERSFTIAEFYERVRRALQEQFPEEIWITGEIRGLRESRGHRYLELADKGVDVVGRGVAQQLEVVCWSRDWPTIAHALGEAGVDLEVGRVVRVRGKVSVWEGGSKLRFTLTALDIEALLGGIAAARRRLLAALEREGLLEKNRGLPLAIVPLRVGIVTSPGSEAHRDFVGQLERSGYAFDVKLEPSLVQGAEAPTQIAAALQRLGSFEPDIAVLIRGGGARGDLAAFDAEEVARAIALAPFPIWTGIGHTSDRSVADEVAHRSLITPTACGEAVVAVVHGFWMTVMQQVASVSQSARARLDSANQLVTGNSSSLMRAVRHQLTRRSDATYVARNSLSRSLNARIIAEKINVGSRADRVSASIARALFAGESDLTRRKQVLAAYDPKRQLERGWSLVHDESGRLVRSAQALSVGERIRSRFFEGEAFSIVESLSDDGGTGVGEDRKARNGEPGGR